MGDSFLSRPLSVIIDKRKLFSAAFENYLYSEKQYNWHPFNKIITGSYEDSRYKVLRMKNHKNFFKN